MVLVADNDMMLKKTMMIIAFCLKKEQELSIIYLIMLWNSIFLSHGGRLGDICSFNSLYTLIPHLTGLKNSFTRRLSEHIVLQFHEKMNQFSKLRITSIFALLQSKWQFWTIFQHEINDIFPFYCRRGGGGGGWWRHSPCCSASRWWAGWSCIWALWPPAFISYKFYIL